MSRILTLTAVLLLLAPAAFGHALLRKAVPGVGSTLHAAPPQLELSFSEGVEPKFSRVEVDDAAGKRVDGGDLHGDPADPKRLLLSLGALAAGTYTVVWHATSVDTHKTEGKFTFTVAP